MNRRQAGQETVSPARLPAPRSLWLFAVVSLIVTAWSLLLDQHPPLPASFVCRAGLCRNDQIFSAIDASGADPATLRPC